MKASVSFIPTEIISADELGDLRKLHLEITALQDRCILLYPVNWFANADRARAEFRRNPSVAAVDVLLELLTRDPEHMVNSRAFEKVRDDLMFGAHHIYEERGVPLLKRIAARAANLTATTLQRTLELDQEMAGNSHERFAGPLPKTKQVAALEEQGEMIAVLQSRLALRGPVMGQFSFNIAEMLATVGVDLEMEISEWASKPVEVPEEPSAEDARAKELAALDDVQLRAVAHSYGVIIEAEGFDRAAAIRTILSIAPK